MDLLTITGIAVSLAMDAFSVSIAAGISLGNPTPRHYFRLAFHFGLFQFFMPILGYFGGVFVEQYIKAYDHWLALVLLAFVGIKMIKESFEKKEAGFSQDPSRGLTLIFLSVATSIDAMAVGLSFGMMRVPIVTPSIIIGIVCAFFSIIGLSIGKRVGTLFGHWVERAGGLVLIAIGLKILFEHTIS
ncbi:MAG: hypothetical protein A2487_16850 [Candidatus Raymondbacteria bacterium RifOxyC12_full_50_8]|uniref:Putative manganese efflux pump MntP n=1 Tax=Candidatus Raymondbacteria bacterium RIFOXYD12_FULL_49_13 TaxID=1817890 RepID=A0A1F7F0B4_UNCRA|nr:MAG: hypothetical protein A2248_21725 [Candidatus Raymondbacteria bacterium RIFOXYA2_FULL_49_16]OGK00058.1 MAG: hypothetical protein A2519_22280 [Candidatus Raymondbacteria bacterium RIFOXYD12_FULL_49_13]OGK01348.1 MAG: hypothetical protein A2487_16850 [Candidatus Raymondbacteria bacterium RifOxyC12_full_50_8]OGK03675.1 MAG: hypothetical protein A2350_12960 [Candidatus Raymondbacteria bacterium RifOxyB12_full_50_8]OGP45047.1 MAG: hypothetical protein A2324_13605 [Candidatus Raymondbacteria b